MRKNKDMSLGEVSDLWDENDFSEFDDITEVKDVPNSRAEALKQDAHQRESRWTESITVGSKTFVEETKKQLQSRAKGRKIEGYEEVYELCDRDVLTFYPQKLPLRLGPTPIRFIQSR